MEFRAALMISDGPALTQLSGQNILCLSRRDPSKRSRPSRTALLKLVAQTARRRSSAKAWSEYHPITVRSWISGGIDGLLQSPTWSAPRLSPKPVLNVGDTVQVKVIALIRVKRSARTARHERAGDP